MNKRKICKHCGKEAPLSKKGYCTTCWGEKLKLWIYIVQVAKLRLEMIWKDEYAPTKTTHKAGK